MWTLSFGIALVISAVPSGSSADPTAFAIKKIPAEVGTAPLQYPFHLRMTVNYTDINYIQFCDATIYNDELALSALNCLNASGLMAIKNGNWDFVTTLNTLTGQDLRAASRYLQKVPLEEGGLIKYRFWKTSAFQPRYFVTFPKLWHGEKISELENFGVVVMGKTEDDLERGIVGVIKSSEICQKKFKRKLQPYEGCVHGLAGSCAIYPSNPVLLAVSKRLVGLITKVSSDGCHALMTTTQKFREIEVEYLKEP